MPLSSVYKLLLVVAACALSTVAVAASSADCINYATYFPYAETSSECIVTNMCYTRTFCCPYNGMTDYSTCLDITTFSCDLAAACVNHTDDASWYPYTSDTGASVECCSDTVTTTPAPSVPGFLPSGDSASPAVPTTSSDSSSASVTSLPAPVRMCDDSASQACTVTSKFPALIRAFCGNAIPATYSDTYIVQSLPYVCCKYAATPSGSTQYEDKVGTTVCGSDLLDLPRVGEYLCSMRGRSDTVCCNGMINPVASTGAPASSSSSASVETTYTYLNNTCLYVPEPGDGAVVRGASMMGAVVLAAFTAMLLLL